MYNKKQISNSYNNDWLVGISRLDRWERGQNENEYLLTLVSEWLQHLRKYSSSSLESNKFKNWWNLIIAILIATTYFVSRYVAEENTLRSQSPWPSPRVEPPPSGWGKIHLSTGTDVIDIIILGQMRCTPLSLPLYVIVTHSTTYKRSEMYVAEFVQLSRQRRRDVISIKEGRKYSNNSVCGGVLKTETI